MAAVAQLVRNKLTGHIGDVRAAKVRKLDEFVAQDHPQYRPYLEAAKQKIDRLPETPGKTDIEIALHRAKIEGREEMLGLVDEIAREHAVHGQVKETADRLVARFAQEANRANLSALGDLVCTRRAVIDVLKANLRNTAAGKGSLERVFHDLIFPRHKTSADIPTGPSEGATRGLENLWLIDERLVYHSLLASDQPLSVAGLIMDGDTPSKDDEPDILVFEPAMVTSEGDDLNCVAIVEFKRPGRNDYNEMKNPINQIIAAARS